MSGIAYKGLLPALDDDSREVHVVLRRPHPPGSERLLVFVVERKPHLYEAAVLFRHVNDVGTNLGNAADDDGRKHLRDRFAALFDVPPLGVGVNGDPGRYV